jgi:tetratricopeptide (TPR) repeat protein
MKWLSWSWSLGRIRGVEIRFHFSMLFSIPIAYYLFRPINFREMATAFLWVTGLLLCIFLHEFGHMLAAQLMGVEVKSIVIWLLGGFTNLSRKAEKPSHQLLISAAGPLVNMFLAFVCVLFYIIISFLLLPSFQDVRLFLWAQMIVNLLFSLTLVNLVLVVFNVLPVYPLDGGNILHSLMELFFGKTNADLITLIIGAPILLALIIFSLVANDYLLFLSCVLIGLALGTLNHSSQHWINLGFNYLFRRAGYHYLQGDFERAAQYYTRDIEREPQQAGHYLARAACYLNLLQKEKARADAERALKLTPQSAVALQLRGELYSMDKDYDSALDFFTRAREINPNWAVPYFDRGAVLLDQREFLPALKELDRAVSLLPNFALFHVMRSMAHFRLGDLDSAHRDQDLAVNLSEKDALTMLEVNMQIYEGWLDWAEDYYARVLAKHPHCWRAYQGRADACRINNEHARAAADYTRAIELNPREMRLFLSRGKSHAALNEFEKARADFQSSIAATDKLHLKRQAEDLLNKMTAVETGVGE